MPLVRIDLNEGRSDNDIKAIMNTIHECVVDAFKVPANDRYQIVTEHKPGRMVLLDTGLGFERSEQAIVIQVFTSPRSTVMKTQFYKNVTEKLSKETGLSPKDVLISVITNTDADWSFGFGESQYLTGSL